MASLMLGGGHLVHKAHGDIKASCSIGGNRPSIFDHQWKDDDTYDPLLISISI
jgi:hypothetical protein